MAVLVEADVGGKLKSRRLCEARPGQGCYFDRISNRDTTDGCSILLGFGPGDMLRDEFLA